MMKNKLAVWGLIVGMSVIWAVSGCGSRIETTIMSSSAPEKPEVKVTEAREAVQAPGPTVSQPEILEQSLGIPPIDIPVQAPAKPDFHQESASNKIFAAPKEGAIGTRPDFLAKEPVEMRPKESLPQERAPSEPVTVTPGPEEVGQGIPPVVFGSEEPVNPTIRKESPPLVGERIEPLPIEPPPLIGKIEPEPLEQSKKEEAQEAPVEVMVPSEAVEPQQEEKAIEVAKVMPSEPERSVAARKREMLQGLEDVYFDYDRFSIRNDAKRSMEINSELLLGQLADEKFTIEGHCDERGTQSYNLVLGERRAQAVKEYLVDLGVPEEKLEVVTFGKEKPFCTEHRQECWQQNRRGHFALQ